MRFSSLSLNYDLNRSGVSFDDYLKVVKERKVKQRKKES